MQDLDLADPELVLIINITENKVCNDCQKKNPRWCSINNAVLLCASCARKHRKFNEYISKIKSLEGDLWTKDEIKRLYIGGNERFNQMLKSYNIPLTNDNAEYKYHTKIAGYYRDLLSEELKGKKVIDLVKPSMKEGIEILSKEEYDKLNQYIPSQDNILQNDNNNNNINNNSDVLNIPKSNIFANPFALHINLNNDNNDNNNSNNFNNRNNNNNFNNNTREDTFEHHLNDFADTMGTVFNNISQKAQSIDYNEKLKNAGDYIMDKKEKIENSETFKGFMSALSTGIDSLVRKTEDFFNDSLDNNLYRVNNDQRGNVNRFNNRNQKQFNFQGQRINNRSNNNNNFNNNNNNFNNNNRNMNNNFNNNNLNKNVSNYRPINNNMNNSIPLNNMNNNVSQNNMNNNVPINNMSNNNAVQNQNNINNNVNNNDNFNNVNINIEDIETPDGEDDIPKIIYNNSPQNLNNQGEQNNNSNNNGNNNNNNAEKLDGNNNEKNNNDNNIESLDGNINEKNNNP